MQKQTFKIYILVAERLAKVFCMPPIFKRFVEKAKSPKDIVKSMSWRLFGVWKNKIHQCRERKRLRSTPLPTIFNVLSSGEAEPTSRPKALITYVVAPFMADFNPAVSRRHANHWRCLTMCRMLKSRGYQVDVTHWENPVPPDINQYSIVLGHGPAFEISCRRANRKVIKIYLGTIAPFKQLLSGELKRIRALYNRRKAKVGRRYFSKYNSDNGPKFADILFLLGNDWVKKQYLLAFPQKPVFMYSKSYEESILPQIEGKDWLRARKKFLWIASYAAVHRGLDVLLEVFDRFSEHELYICGSIEHDKEFIKCYRRELYENPRIHMMGWVDVGGAEFASILQQCAFMIYPSASDTMPGSVVNSMAAGLIPLVTIEAGLDMGEHGYIIEACTPKCIQDIVMKVSNIDIATLEKEAHNILSYARQRYSKDVFKQEFDQFLRKTVPCFQQGK